MSLNNKQKLTLKVLILGDSTVGKSSLVTRYVHKRFDHKLKLTIGADFSSKVFDLENQCLTLQIWDTAGQERFRSLGTAFYRGADCCLLVYDVTSEDTFKNLKIWQNEFLRHAAPNDPENFPFVVLGNKVDLDRKVPRSQAAEWCKLNKNIPFFETSALDNTNVDTAFRTIASMALNKPEPRCSIKGDEDFVDFLSSPKKSSGLCTCT